MADVGFDTIRFHKAYDPYTVQELIEPYIGQGYYETEWFKGFMLFRNPRNKNVFSFQNSFAKYASERGNNLIPATMDMMKEAIAKFEEESGLQVKDAYVSRLDVAMNMEMEHQPKDYKKLMREFNGYKFPEKEKEQENTGYMQSGEKSLVLYDKKKEMEEKGREDERLDGVQNLLRVELQLKRHVEKGLGMKKGMAPLTLGSLSETYGFISGVKTLEDETIRLLALGKHEKEKTMTRQAIEHAAMKRMLALHYDDMEKVLMEVMQENNVEKNVAYDVMQGYEKRKTKNMGEELYHGIKEGCNMVYGACGMQRETVEDELLIASKDVMRRLEEGFYERVS